MLKYIYTTAASGDVARVLFVMRLAEKEMTSGKKFELVVLPGISASTGPHAENAWLLFVRQDVKQKEIMAWHHRNVYIPFALCMRTKAKGAAYVNNSIRCYFDNGNWPLSLHNFSLYSLDNSCSF